MKLVIDRFDPDGNFMGHEERDALPEFAAMILAGAQPSGSRQHKPTPQNAAHDAFKKAKALIERLEQEQ